MSAKMASCCLEVTPGYIDDEELSLGGDSPDVRIYL